VSPQRWRGAYDARLRRSDPADLLGADRPGLRGRALSHPAEGDRIESRAARRDILEIRHCSLYAPRDFDISPYFAVVKPTIENGFDYKALHWADLPRRTAEPEEESDAVPEVVAQPAMARIREKPRRRAMAEAG
jgi:hypothetical protein